MRLLLLALLIGPATALAQAPGETPVLTSPVTPPVMPEAIDGRDTNRIMIGPAYGIFASYPMSIADESPALVLGKPLWLGQRKRAFQWALDAIAVVGYGTTSKHVHVIGGSQFGFNLYFGRRSGMEFRWGLAAIAQIGDHSVGGLGMTGGGGYVFRFWDDDRKRLKLWAQMTMGAFFASDPGNDVGMNAGAMLVALAYEAPL